MFGKKDKKIKELEERIATLELGFASYAKALDCLNTLVTINMFDVLSKLSYAQECLVERIEQLYNDLEIETTEEEKKILN